MRQPSACTGLRIFRLYKAGRSDAHPCGMLGRTLKLLRAELTKSWRTKLPWLGALASALMALIARQSIASQEPGSVTAASYFQISLNMSTTIVIPIFAAIFGAMTVASETSRGTLRMILTRPVHRGEFLTAKLLSALIYLVVLMSANVLVAAWISRGYPVVSTFDRNVDIPPMPEQVRLFAVAVALGILPQIATVCFAFLVSVLAPNVATAISIAVGTLLSLQPAKQFIRFGEFELNDWLFMSYYDTATGIASNLTSGIPDQFAQERIYFLLGTSLISAVLFLAVSYIIFLRRDLNG